MLDVYHKPQEFSDTFKTSPFKSNILSQTKPSDLFLSSDTHKPTLIKTLEGSPFTKHTDERPFGGTPDLIDAQSINNAFTYQTSSSTTSTTEKTTTPYNVPSQPSFSDTKPLKSFETTTSLYSNFEKNTKAPKNHMSLVIEGHSKVKTYKPGQFDPKEKHRPVLIPVTPLGDPINRRIVNTEEDGKIIEVKHLHSKEERKSETKKVENHQEKSAISSLLSFLDTSFGSLVIQEESSEELDEEKLENLKNLQGNNIDKENYRNGKKIKPLPEKPHFVMKKTTKE